MFGIKRNIANEIAHQFSIQYKAFTDFGDLRVTAAFSPFADGVNGHLDRVKQVIRMVEMDLRAEIETQRDRITVLNKRVQMLEGKLPLDALDLDLAPIYRARATEDLATKGLYTRPGRFIPVDGVPPPRDDNEVEPRS